MPRGGTGPLSADGGVISTLHTRCHFNLAPTSAPSVKRRIILYYGKRYKVISKSLIALKKLSVSGILVLSCQSHPCSPEKYLERSRLLVEARIKMLSLLGSTRHQSIPSMRADRRSTPGGYA